MVSVTLAGWAEQHNVMLEFIKPGRQTNSRLLLQAPPVEQDILPQIARISAHSAYPR